jgi:hypothetical protein
MPSNELIDQENITGAQKKKGPTTGGEARNNPSFFPQKEFHNFEPGFCRVKKIDK